MTTNDDVSVLKHLNEKIDILFATHRELHASEEKARQVALEISIHEVERRLDSLNGEAARLVAIQKNYLPRETYEMQSLEFRRDIDQLRMFEANIRGQILAYASIISFAVGIALFIVGRLWK